MTHPIVTLQFRDNTVTSFIKNKQTNKNTHSDLFHIILSVKNGNVESE